MRTYTHEHIHTYTLNGRLPLRVIEHIYTPLRVIARDPRPVRNYAAVLGTWGAWRMRRLEPAALGALQRFPEASRGPDEPETMFRDVPRAIWS